MQHLVVSPARGQMPGFQITAKRPVDVARLGQAFNYQNLRGEAMSMRVRYTLHGAPTEEDFFTFYTAVQTIPYTGPEARPEFHRMLLLACGGRYRRARRLQRPPGRHGRRLDPERRELPAPHPGRPAGRQSGHNAYQKRGYDSIYAAGQLSRSISANNDALLSSM